MRKTRATRPVDYQALAGNKGGIWSDSDDDRPARVRSPASVDMMLHRTLPPIKAKPVSGTNQPPRPMSAHAMYAGPHQAPPPGGRHRMGNTNGSYRPVPVSPVSAKHSEAAATLVDLFYSLPVETSGRHSQPPPHVHLDLDASWYTQHGRGADLGGARSSKPTHTARVKRPREEDEHVAVCCEDCAGGMHATHDCVCGRVRARVCAQTHRTSACLHHY